MPNQVIKNDLELSTARKILALEWAEQVVLSGEKRSITSEELRKIALQADRFAGMLSDICVAYYDLVRTGQREIPQETRSDEQIAEERSFWRELYEKSVLYSPETDNEERFK